MQQILCDEGKYRILLDSENWSDDDAVGHILSTIWLMKNTIHIYTRQKVVEKFVNIK